MQLRTTLALFSLVSLFSAVGAAATPQTFLTLNGQPRRLHWSRNYSDLYAPGRNLFHIEQSGCRIDFLQYFGL
jgi:hypothetical protein